VDPVVSTPRRKGPLSPDFEVAMAETRLQMAMVDPPPPNKDAILDSVRSGYQRALKQDPKHKDALLGIARMYAKIGDKSHSAEAYEKYLKVYPKDAEVMHEIAMKRAQMKDFAGAVAMCESALKFDPENRSYCKTMGFCQARIGQWDAAFASLSKVMPEEQVRHNLAGMLDHMGQGEMSRTQLQLALKANPEYAPSKDFLNELMDPNDANGAIQQAGHVQPK
jgi:Tfp pilus assembly protein PilF